MDVNLILIWVSYDFQGRDSYEFACGILYDCECRDVYDYECGQLCDYECRSYTATNVAVMFMNVAVIMLRMSSETTNVRSEFFTGPAFPGDHDFPRFSVPPKFSHVPSFRIS